MAEPQHFLRRCHRFPRSAAKTDREVDCSSNCPRCEFFWGNSYELSVPLEALLENENTADLLFEFAELDFYEEDDYDDYGNLDTDCVKNKIIWLSTDTFICTKNAVETVDHILHDYLDHIVSKAYTIDFQYLYSNEGVWIIQQAALAAERGPVESDLPSPRFVDVMNVLLRLVAKRTTITDVAIRVHLDADNVDAGFPASLDALKAFVGETQSERTIFLQDAGLSQAQWNSVASNCKKNVAIRFEAWSKEMLFTCIEAIPRNGGLRRLELDLCHFSRDTTGPLDDFTLEEWELVFCGSIASHPTLQEVKVSLERYNSFLITSAEKDDILTRTISQNTVLCKLEMDGRLIANKPYFDSVVHPVLEFNRFRHFVQAIKQETNAASRQQLFTTTLLSNQVCRHPAHRYLLLKENFDLLQQSPSVIEGILLSDWDKTLRHLMSLQMRMLDRGVAFPTSLLEDMVTLNGRKSSKRSRTS